MNFKSSFLITFTCLLYNFSNYAQDEISSNNNLLDMKKILGNDSITILVTDSGLGGMSVCAGIENKLREIKSFKEVNLIYFNALPEKGKGYNQMPSLEIKAEVFNEALISMEEKFKPDLIMIACNTLSVVYPHTEFSRTAKTPVLGIVDFGVSMILSELKNSSSEIIILGTPTTINAGTHKQKLIDNGVNTSKVISQACPNLESKIQENPHSQNVITLIEQYLCEAVQNLNDSNEQIIAALCCTHYDFSKEIFQSVFDSLTNRKVLLLNPNELMISAVVLEENINKFNNCTIKVRVVSRALINDSEKFAISSLIKSFAPLSALALESYEHDINLFEFLH